MHCLEIGLINFNRMSDKLFFGYRHDFDMVYLQQWAGKILSDMTLVNHVNELSQCHNKIIFMHVIDANYYIDVTRQLIANNNYMIFYHLSEVLSDDFDGLITDCPQAKNFSFILGGINKDIETLPIDFWYFTTLTDHNVMRAQLHTLPQKYQKANKPFQYLYLNGAHRPHRQALWNALSNRKLLDHALKSYLGYENNQSKVCKIPMTLLPKSHESPYLDQDKILPFKDQLRNYRTFKADAFRGHWVDGHIVPEQYIDTYFSLIAETTVESSELFLTEKTWKPILAGHPFIILGSPGLYKELHKRGFKTFGDFIDESFDDEEDLDTRINMIVNEVEKLCTSDLDLFLSQTKDICVYNHEHYINNKRNLHQKTHYELNQFIDQIISKFST